MSALFHLTGPGGRVVLIAGQQVFEVERVRQEPDLSTESISISQATRPSAPFA
jgi:hypothetical protein